MAPFEFELGFDDVASAVPKQPKTKATGVFNRAMTGMQASSNTARAAAEDDGDGGADFKVKIDPKDISTIIQSHGKKRPYSSMVETVHQPELSIGLDFGMTFSGIAQASTRAGPSAVKVMQQWLGTLEIRDKVPTLLALKEENPSVYFDKEARVGYEVGSTMNVRGYLKYAMDKDAPATKYDDPILEADVGKLILRTPLGENTMQHAVEYLRNLYDLYIAKLRRDMPNAFFERLRLFWTITHPVACSEEGKSHTLKAVRAAGIGSRKHDQVCLTSEAEAAIIAAFAYAQGCYGPNTFKVKTNVTMLDIGGLTIDSATFYLKAGDPRLKLDQVCVSEGGKCGGITIFCRFYELCTQWLGVAFTDLPQYQIGAGSKFLKDFELEIRGFDGKNLDKKLRLPLAMDIKEQDHYRMGEVVFTGHDMKACIDPLLEYSRKILCEQFSTAEVGNSKVVSTVVLGGGLALCQYIEATLKEFCQQQPKGLVELVRPGAAWSLVARGAAIRGLKTNIVEGRRSRAWYGVAGHRKLDADEDRDDADFDDPINGWRVAGAMKWHVKKSERITAGTKAKAVKAYIVLSQEQIEELEELSGVIPLYKYDGNDEQAPTSVDHPEVCKVGNISIDLSDMSAYARKAIKQACQQSDDANQQLRLTIEQNVNADSGLIEFTARVGKTKVGKHALRHGTMLGRSIL